MAKDISFNDKELVDFERRLRKFRFAIPIADQQARNDAVFDGQKTARKIIDKKFINRNKWTKGSIKVDKSTKGFQNPAVLGSVAPYMADQEFGGVSKKQGREGRRITTSVASGEGRGARPRRKVARGKNKIRKIRLPNTRIKAKNSKQRDTIAIQDAKRKGYKYVFLEFKHRKRAKGIYKLKGRKNVKIDLVHSLFRKFVRIKRSPWLKPTVKDVMKRAPGYYRKRLSAQVKRHLEK